MYNERYSQADGALSPVAKTIGWKETRAVISAQEHKVTVSAKDFKRLSKNVRFNLNAIPLGYEWYFPKKIIYQLV